jgi:membrane-associated phospholipid phosphatase
MEDSGAAPAATPRAARWRPFWMPAGLLLFLVFLTVNVVAGGPLVALDRHIRGAVHRQATSATWRWLTNGRLAPAQLITDLGAVEIAGSVLAVTALVIAIRLRSLRPVITAAAAAALLAATVIPGKILIGRPGPGYAVLTHGAWGDFPSGHASTAGVCYGLTALLLTAQLQARTLRRAVAAVAAAVCFLVGVALVWCDYHWFTDVLAGWALAALIVWAVWQAQQRVASWHRPGPASTAQSHIRQSHAAERHTAERHTAEEHTT